MKMQTLEGMELPHPSSFTSQARLTDWHKRPTCQSRLLLADSPAAAVPKCFPGRLAGVIMQQKQVAAFLGPVLPSTDWRAWERVCCAAQACAAATAGPEQDLVAPCYPQLGAAAEPVELLGAALHTGLWLHSSSTSLMCLLDLQRHHWSQPFGTCSFRIGHKGDMLREAGQL